MVDAGSVYSEIRIKMDKLTGDIQSVNTEFDKMASASQKTGEKIKNNFEGSADKGAKAMHGLSLEGVAAFALITEGIKKSIESFSQFESSMQRNRAVMTGGASDFAKLEEAALKTGSSSEFSAKQAADALFIFSKAGYDAATSIKLLDTSQELAKASGTDLTETSKILKTTLQQFNLGVDQADRLANVFAAAKLPLEDISATMRMVGPVASGMGIKIEEVTAVIKKLSSAGMEGEMVGSSLRFVLGDIGDTTSALSKKLVEYGIDLSKVNPQTHTLAEIIGELGKAGLSTTDIMTIFGNHAGLAMVTLMGQGQKALEDYTASITGTSEASRQAAIVDDTLEDRMKTMGNAFQVAGIEVVKELAPALKGIVDFATLLIQGFTALPGPVKQFIGIIAIGIPTVLGLSAAFGVLAGLITATALPLVGVVAGLGAIVAIGSAIYNSVDTEAKVTKQLDESSSALAKTLADMKKIKEGLTDSNKKLNATERENLDIQLEKLKLDQAKQLKDVIAAYDKYEKLIKDNNVEINRYNKYLAESDETQQRFIKNTGKADAVISSNIEGYKNLNTELKNKNVLVGQDEQKQINLLAVMVNRGDIELSDINKINKALGDKVSTASTLLQLADEENKKTEESTGAIVKKTNALAPLTAAQKSANEAALQAATDYQEKIEKLGASEERVIDIERKAAIAKVASSEASADAKQKEIDAINEYYDALRDDRAENIHAENAKKSADDIKAAIEGTESVILGGVENIASSLSGLFAALYKQRMDDLDAQMIAEEKAAGVAADTAVQTAQKELDEAMKSGDKQVIADKQKALKKAQIEEDYAKKKAKLDYEGQHAAWQMQLLSAIAGGALAIINAYSSASAIPVIGWVLGPIAAGIAAIAAGLQIGAVAASEPKPPSFDTGGIYMGPTGGTATLMHGELMVTPAQQANLLAMLNGSGGNQGGDININNEFGGIYSDLDYERYNRDMVKKVQAAKRAR